MNFRTISVKSVGGELLNAALVCSFLAREIDREFVVYSLNEKLDNNLVQVYVSSIVSEKDACRLAGATPAEFKVAANLLKSIIRDASASTPAQTDERYRLLDLSEVPIDPDYVQAHHNLQINGELLLKLLQFCPEHSAAQIAEAPASEAPRAAQPLQVKLHCNDYYSLSGSLRLGEQGPQPSPQELLDRLSGNAALSVDNSEPAGTHEQVQAPDPRHGVARRIDEQLQTLMADMQNHKGALQGKHDQWHKTSLEQKQRQRELAERATALDLRETELNAGLASLASAEATLAELIRLINNVDGGPH